MKVEGSRKWNVDELTELLAAGRAGRSGAAGCWLFPDDASREAARRRILQEATYRPVLDVLEAEAQRFLREPVSELIWSELSRVWKDGHRKSYEKLLFNRRQRLTAFGLLSWLMPERADVREALLNTVWAICDEFTWCVPVQFAGPPGSGPAAFTLADRQAVNEDPGLQLDLFTAEAAFALSEVYRMTGDDWPEAVRNRMYKEVYRRVFQPFLHDGPYFWEQVRNNWAAVCAGSTGAAAIHLIEDDRELATILAKALPILSIFMEGFGDDGACPEGYMYWGYGFGFYTYFADLLARRTSGALDLLASDHARQVALFQQKVFLSGRHPANFSDSTPAANVYIGLTHRLHRQYPDVHVPPFEYRGVLYDHCGRWAPALRNLIWHDPLAPERDWEDGDFYLADAQWVVSRVTQTGERYSFAAKGGHNGEPHNHNDIGHFILHAGGETFLHDLGNGMYTKAYFGPERYSLACNGSQGHSVPIVNGRTQREGPEHAATGVTVDREADRVTFAMDLTRAYEDDSLQRLTRRFEWNKRGEPPSLAVVDEYRFSEIPASVTERFILGKPPEIAEPGLAIVRGERGQLALRYDPELVAPAVAALPFIDHFERELVFYALDFRLADGRVEPNLCLRFDFRMSLT